VSASGLANLSSLIDGAECRALVRQQRWPDGVRCPGRGGAEVIRRGRDGTRRHRRRDRRKGCDARLDDPTGTVSAGHRRPPRVRVPCLSLTGPNLSNRRIAREPDPAETDARATTGQLRHGPAAEPPPARPEGGVDEAYVVAGHKGRPAAVAEKGARADAGGRAARPAGARPPRTSRPPRACRSGAARPSRACPPTSGRRRSGR
jgi:hypothetical protein